MVHSLATTGGNQVALPSNWGTAPSGASMSNPFAAFSIQIGSASRRAFLPPVPRALRALRAEFRCRCSDPRERSSFLWTSCLRTGGTSLKTRLAATSTAPLSKSSTRKSRRCWTGVPANHITEELLMRMLNRAAELGIGTNDRRFPVVRLPLSLLREPLFFG